MATLCQHSQSNDHSALCLTVRPWASAATNESVRLVLGDASAPARSCLWAEIGYGLAAAPLIYLRLPLEMAQWTCAAEAEELIRGAVPYITWRSACPAGLLMIRPGPEDPDGQATFQATLQLNVANLTDSGQEAGVTLALDGIRTDALLQFSRILDAEIRQALAGQPPLPEAVPPSPRENPFSSRINAAAYDAVGAGYTHDYLEEPFFRRAFDSWLQLLPGQAQVLEIGCGHGEPIAAALVLAGHRVTGIDPSGAMIQQARQTVPTADFRQMSLVNLDDVERFDGGCSFFSFLCMDPIELRLGLDRLHSALKPGAPLLIVSGVPDLYNRTSPLRTVQGRTTWEWSYDHQDMAAALEEQGQWEVVSSTVQYYDVDTMQQIPPSELYGQSADDPGLTAPVKGVFALVARSM